jgi:hypothetical protein
MVKKNKTKQNKNINKSLFLTFTEIGKFTWGINEFRIWVSAAFQAE